MRFHITNEGCIDAFVTSWCGIVATEIPVTRTVGTRFVQIFDAKIDHMDLCVHACGAQKFNHFLIDF